jgi:hypothetical protein
MSSILYYQLSDIRYYQLLHCIGILKENGLGMLSFRIIIPEIHGIAGLIEVNIFIAILKGYIFSDNCRC